MVFGIDMSAGVEELDLSVRAYKLLRAAGIRVIDDLQYVSMLYCWESVCNKSRAAFSEILLKLDEFGIRLIGCSSGQYPDLVKAIPQIIGSFEGKKEKHVRKPSVQKKKRDMFAGISSKLSNSSDMILATFEESAYGIINGSMLVIDKNQEFQDDVPGCFINKATREQTILRNWHPGYEYVGKLLAVINTTWPAAV